MVIDIPQVIIISSVTIFCVFCVWKGKNTRQTITISSSPVTWKLREREGEILYRKEKTNQTNESIHMSCVSELTVVYININFCEYCTGLMEEKL